MTAHNQNKGRHQSRPQLLCFLQAKQSRCYDRVRRDTNPSANANTIAIELGSGTD
jgi:hypothetical protein